MPQRPEEDNQGKPTAARLRALLALGKRLGHGFQDPLLLDRALCHASLANDGRPSYERLEFLGDAVLGFVVTEHLYLRCPDVPEGRLTELRSRAVSRTPLARIAVTLGLPEHLLGGRGLRERDRQSQRIHADLCEAVLGAIFLDGGLRAARRFVQRTVLAPLDSLLQEGRHERDPKSRLLHWAQSRRLGQPHYSVLSEAGPEHDREFTVAVHLKKRGIATGCGRTKQEAEKDAARRALEALQNEPAAVPL
jgi:ribonuclease-3